MTRGQAAVEFIVLSGFMILVFTTFFLVIEERSSLEKQQDQQEQLVQIANVIEQEVLLASQVEEGYGRTFELPLTIGTEPYEIRAYPIDRPSEIVIVAGQGDDEVEYVLFLQENLTPSNIQPGLNKIVKDKDGSINITGTEDDIVWPPPECEIDQDCNDNNICTGDSCVEDQGRFECQNIPINDGDPCDDGQLCTGNPTDMCKNGVCVGEPKECAVEGAVCNPETGLCDLCDSGYTRNEYLAGVDGYDWDEVGTSSRTEQPEVAGTVCAHIDLECAVEGGSPVALGGRNTNNNHYLCQPESPLSGKNPTWFRCGNGGNAGDQDGVEWANECCSKRTNNGNYNWGAAGSAYKIEADACDDGSDNDCDGLVDCADTADCGSDPSCLCAEKECNIGGECYPDVLDDPVGAMNPDNSCQACVVATNKYDWTPVNEGKTCEDGLFCTDQEVCVSGVCSGKTRACPKGTVCDEVVDKCACPPGTKPSKSGVGSETGSCVEADCSNTKDDDNNGATDCADAACGVACPEMNQTVCNAWPDVTPNDLGIHYFSPWQGDLLSPNCCGNNIGEYYLETEPGGFATGRAVRSCCNGLQDCTRSGSTCVNNNAFWVRTLLPDLYCRSNIYYECSKVGHECKFVEDTGATNECYPVNIGEDKGGEPVFKYEWRLKSQAPADPCDGVDNDCDGVIDNNAC